MQYRVTAIQVVCKDSKLDVGESGRHLQKHLGSQLEFGLAHVVWQRLVIWPLLPSVNYPE